MNKIKDVSADLHYPKSLFNGVKIVIGASKYNERIKRAQFWLDSNIDMSMQPYIPIDKGTLKNLIHTYNMALAGSGEVVVYTSPYGRYQYEGVKMVDSVTGKGARRIELDTGEVIFRHRKGATLVPTGIPLNYTSPTAERHWWESAKRDHSKEWIKGVKRIVVNGK